MGAKYFSNAYRHRAVEKCREMRYTVVNEQPIELIQEFLRPSYYYSVLLGRQRISYVIAFFRTLSEKG